MGETKCNPTKGRCVGFCDRTTQPLQELHLARYFGVSPRFWLGLQIDYDLDVAEDEGGDRIRQEIVTIVNHL
ncbi:hypothetical protein VB780_09720 [Leptolyngbya sp. CCNP1308]|uniref:helix-turn-helix transcriptional regulator n=1 Tax=Leptolyngbya sp. CCNP1308 TaxID=3110255 RepID=UPI002B207512|nr:hypothetical protein [Leptolyngbya sp. CCNP1308]MEA5448845.1 hypothetical protein [Leptolyngbya sp. CCNP1308]